MRALLPLLALSACVVHVPDDPQDDRPVGQQPAPPPAQDAPTPPDSRPPPPQEPEACEPDMLEPNDSTAVVTDGDLRGLTLDAGDVDLFAVDVQPGDLLQIDASFAPAAGDLDLYLTLPEGDLLDWSTSTEQEWIDYTHEGPAQTLWIETNLYEPADDTCVTYDLSWSITPATLPDPTPPPPPAPPPVCTDDVSEPNQTWDDAVELVPTADGTVLFDFTSTDDDWFYLYATADEQLTITVRHDTPGAALDLFVWDELGEVADLGMSAGVNTSVTVNGGAAGQYVDLLVAPLDAQTCAPYTIRVDSSLPVCFEDGYEPNDNVPSPLAGPLNDLTLPAGDVDRFEITLYPGEELWVDALFDHSLGNVDLALLDVDGYIVDTSYGTGNSETVAVFNDSPFAETFIVEASLWGATPDTCQVYDLDWTLYGATCVDDGFEADEAIEGAAELVPVFGTTVAYDLVADGEDWFWLEQLPGEEIDLFVDHGTYGAELELVVYDSYGELAWDLASAPGDSAYAPLYATSGEVYEVLVRPITQETCVPYTLTVSSW